MYNWSVDETSLRKNPEQFERFTLEQAINFGLNGTKLSRSLLKKYWKILDIDPHRRAYLKTLLWSKS
jgi:hypothetical protein